jgi:hypothetical protein
MDTTSGHRCGPGAGNLPAATMVRGGPASFKTQHRDRPENPPRGRTHDALGSIVVLTR